MSKVKPLLLYRIGRSVFIYLAHWFSFFFLNSRWPDKIVLKQCQLNIHVWEREQFNNNA